ncbi:MAG: sulfurtransferase complex subunit TusB [bacterium]|jgi:tRNA 2-thiouridine synthesizing protein B|nr:sulfurtransferase complex subunit TusB [Gammaproteobacteria bacterium]HIL82198.1 sulfurtransferase complex subunit TusB [Pseudomonadales bacterium]
MIVHTINKVSALGLCNNLIAEGDKVVLLEDGVYLGLQSLPFLVFAIRLDVDARGLGGLLAAQTESIDYSDFVRLCTKADKVCSWF